MTATVAAPTVPADAERALHARAPRAEDLAGPAAGGLRFTDIEERAHHLLPGLAKLRAQVGCTPLLPVPSAAGRGRVWLKLESANITGTVKARTAYALLCAAVAGAGRTDVPLVEYSGGSLAVALAEFCGDLGLDLHLVVPHGSPQTLVDLLRRRGARVSSGRPGTGFLGAIDEAARVARSDGRELLLQHCAAVAVALHRERTGGETVAQLEEHGVSPELVAAAVGTGGTVLGVHQALRDRWPGCTALAVMPAEAPYGDPRPADSTARMNGTGGLGFGLRQPLLRHNESEIEFVTIGYADALGAMRVLRERHHLAVSGSGAGAWLAASARVDAMPSGAQAVAVVAGRGTTGEWDAAAAAADDAAAGQGNLDHDVGPVDGSSR